MWRVPIMLLVLSSALAGHVQAGSKDEASAAVMSAAHQTRATTGKAGLGAQARLRAIQLQLGGALATVEPAVPQRVAPSIAPAHWLIRHAGTTPQSERVRRALQERADGGTSGSGLSYPLGDAVSLGLRYWFLTDEDLADLEMAETGSLKSGYMNHRFLVRARWQF